MTKENDRNEMAWFNLKLKQIAENIGQLKGSAENKLMQHEASMGVGYAPKLAKYVEGLQKAHQEISALIEE